MIPRDFLWARARVREQEDGSPFDGDGFCCLGFCCMQFHDRSTIERLGMVLPPMIREGQRHVIRRPGNVFG
jgi:hypothetical protein